MPVRLLSVLLLLLPHLPLQPRLPLPPPARHDYALFFAVDDYAPGSGFDDLTLPVANAEAIAKELHERYGFTTEVVKNPTLDQISEKLRQYQTFFAKNTQARYPSNGQLLIYFTGHGYAENNNGYFVPADGRLDRLYSTGFAYAIWRPFINRIECRHILVAIDACYSVTFDPDWYDKKMDPEHFRRPGELSEGDRLLLANETDKCRVSFTSDGSEDKVPEKSNFARKMLEGLRSGARNDGILTSEALAGYLRFASPKPRLSSFEGDENGSFLFVQKTGLQAPDPARQTQTAELEKDLLAWKTAKAANTIAAYQDYLTRFPNGEFRQQANDAIGAIQTDLDLRRDDLAWEVAKEKNTAEAYKKYQADFPNGRHRSEAASRLASPSQAEPAKYIAVPPNSLQRHLMASQTDSAESVQAILTFDGYAIQLAAQPTPFTEIDLKKYQYLTPLGNLYIVQDEKMSRLRLGVFANRVDAETANKQVVQKIKYAFVVQELKSEKSLMVPSPNVNNKNVENSATNGTANSDTTLTNKSGAFRPDEFVLVNGGTFNMGHTSEQKDCGDNENPAHKVALSDFYISKYEVTQKQWRIIMGPNPSTFPDCDDCPVENVSWDDVQDFLKKLNQSLPAGQKPYRLPTEAEWEYAARGGGNAILFGNGKSVADPAEINFNGSSTYKTQYSTVGIFRQKTTPVGSFSANALGLYDMSGNVSEWCSDWFGSYSSTFQTNPNGPSSGYYRVVRGGSWFNSSRVCQVAFRDFNGQGNRSDYIGFRLARTF